MVVSAALWGSSWSHKKILFRCDNTAAVEALSSRSAKDPTMAYLLQCLFFIKAQFKFESTAKHIPGRKKTATDVLSHNRPSTFLSLYPQASPPLSIPSSLKQLLLHPFLPWTSVHWANLCKTTFLEISQGELKVRTSPHSTDS